MIKLSLDLAFADNPWIASIPEDRRRKLFEAARIRHFEDGERVYSMGDLPDGFYGILSGHIRMINYPVFGRQLVNGIYSPGTWFGDLSILDGEERLHDAVAAGPTVLAKVPLPAWRQLVSEMPEFTVDLVRLNCRRSRDAVKKFNALMICSSEVRLAQLLLDLGIGDLGPRRSQAMHLSQGDLADMIGATRQIVNRLLRRFEADGIIEIGYASIHVTAPERLEALVA